MYQYYGVLCNGICIEVAIFNYLNVCICMYEVFCSPFSIVNDF